MKDEVKKWLQKRKEEMSKSSPEPPSTQQFVKESQTPPSNLSEAPESSREPKEEFLETEKNKVIPIPSHEEKTTTSINQQITKKLAQNIPVEPKPYQSSVPEKKFPTKKIFLIVIPLVLIAVAIAFLFIFKNNIFPTQSNKNNSITNISQNVISSSLKQYTVSVTHNGIPLNQVPNTIYNNFAYRFTIYDDSLYNKSFCEKARHPESQTTESSFTFNSSSIIEGKPIGDYEPSSYSYRLHAFSIPVTNIGSLTLHSIAKDQYDSNLVYGELPKLENNTTIVFDVPLFNISSINITSRTNTTSIHLEMLDTWSKNLDFYCRFARDDNPSEDSNIKACDNTIALNYPYDYQCARRFYNECSSEDSYIVYATKANRTDKSVNCSISTSILTSGKVYDAWIVDFEVISNNFYKNSMIYLGNFTPSIT